ncbi:MAG: hypothetical protein NDJ92_01065 [Thermoanaerobaculia bacterium]|nr:hypothetical protein [Thermoanaerobaculia bacterium]
MPDHEPPIRILFDDGVCEAVPCELLTDGRARLLATPTASQTAARLGDVVMLEPGDGGVSRFVGIVEQSPFEIFSWPAPKALAACGAYEDLLRRVEETGGAVERAFGGVALVHVTKEARAEVVRRYERIVASDEV